ncbi:MAG: uroporphyrinogen decarboxylase [Chloroflexota bacterium]|nr:MAG: uroporphyrinogen decarboxylase [Chloroflexota bacterium]
MRPDMTKRERVEATLCGHETDRPPWSLWRHFYDRETTVEGLAESMLWFQSRYQFDFLKVNPRAQYHVEDWGVRYRYSSDPHQKPQLVEAPVHQPSDWTRIGPLRPDQGALGEHLRALRLIKQGLKGEVPFIQTIFNPLSIAGDLVATDTDLVNDLRQNPRLVKHALEVITETFVRFALACLDVGVDGIFFATTTLATRATLTPAEYEEFGRPYDLRVLSAIADAPFNVLHVCQDDSLVLELADYPVRALSWAATSPSNPSLGGVLRNIADKAVIGGLSQDALTADDPNQAVEEVVRARDETERRRWMLGPNCSIPTRSRDQVIKAVGREIGIQLP